MALNEVSAVFEDGCTRIRTLPIYQYDYDQMLVIEGLDLPTAFQAHFSNDPTGSESIERIGTNSRVWIPNDLLRTGAPVFAFIFLHDGESDGETVYRVDIPVMVRPELPDGEVTPAEQSAIDEAIAALNTAVELAEGYAEASSTSAQAAFESADVSSDYAEDSEAWAVGKRNGQDVDQEDETYHNNSKFYAFVAQQGAETGGFIQFFIDKLTGHLIYEKTTGVDLVFSLDNGHLIVEG